MLKTITSQNKVIAILLLKGSLHTEARGTNYLCSFSLNHLIIVAKSLTLFHLHRKPKNNTRMVNLCWFSMAHTGHASNGC